MKYFVIEKCLEFNQYVLKNDKEKIQLSLEFYGVQKPVEGDSIAIHENLLNTQSKYFVQPYAFEKTENYPSKLENLNEEFALLKISGNTCVLKRIYG